MFVFALFEGEKSIFKQIYIINNIQKQITYRCVFFFHIFFDINIFKYDFHEQINRVLYRKIVKHLKDVNLYINVFKFMNERLIKKREFTRL